MANVNIFAVVGSIALKDYWEAGTIVFLFAIADWLESLASHKVCVANEISLLFPSYVHSHLKIRQVPHTLRCVSKLVFILF